MRADSELVMGAVAVTTAVGFTAAAGFLMLVVYGLACDVRWWLQGRRHRAVVIDMAAWRAAQPRRRERAR